MEIVRAGKTPEIQETRRYAVHDGDGRVVHVHEVIVLEGGTPPGQDAAKDVLEIVGQPDPETHGLSVLDISKQKWEPNLRYRVDPKTKRLVAFQRLVATAKGFEPTRP